MTRLARERDCSALRWSLLGSGAWVGAEFAVVLISGLVYAVGVALFDWPEPMPAGFKALAYLLSLIAALLSATFISRLLMRIPKEQARLEPPLPPQFTPESDHAS